MTPEELSELAECLDDACREAQRGGWRIVPCCGANVPRGECCPFGALIGPDDNPPYPTFVTVSNCLRRDDMISDVRAFMRGFDGYPNVPDPLPRDAFLLGRSFRERYCT